MNKTKLIQILQTLSNKELKSFGKFASSSFFNVNQQVIHLFNILKPFHSEYNEKEISKKIVFEKLFNGINFDEPKLRYVMTDLTKLLEDFLSYQEYNKQPIGKKHFLLKTLNDRNLDKYFKQHLEEAYKIQQNNPHRDVPYYYNEVILNEEAYAYTSLKDNRAIDSSLQNLVDNIDIHYLSRKLKYACEMINRQNVLSVNYDLKFLEKTVEFLKQYSYEDVPSIAIYFQILLTLQERDNESHYKKLKKLLGLHINKFPKQELRGIYAFAQNYCIRKINTGDTDYLKELFENYKILLEKEIIFEGRYLAQFDFKNIVTVALRLGEFNWVEAFIHKYSANLHLEFKKNAINYNLANLYYATKDYSKALKLLLSVEFTDVYYHLDSKALLLKTYYELEEIEPLLSLIDTFKVYLSRNKMISPYQQTIYNNLIKFVKKLTKIKYGSKKPVQEVKSEIESVKQIADLTWLKTKVAELE